MADLAVHNGTVPLTEEIRLDRSHLPGIAYSVEVQHSPEVEKAFDIVVETLTHPGNRVRSWPHGRMISIPDEQMQALKEYFSSNPGDFGDQLLGDIENGNLHDIARTLEAHNIILLAPDGPVLDVYKVEALYQVDPRVLEAIFGKLETPADKLVVYGVDGEGIQLPGRNYRNSGMAFPSAASHRMIGVVANDSESVNTTVLNEATAVEQFSRYGSDFLREQRMFARRRQEIELVSDAVSLQVEIDPERGRKTIQRFLFRDQFPQYHLIADVIDDAMGAHLELGGPLSEHPNSGPLIADLRRLDRLNALNLHEDPALMQRIAEGLEREGLRLVAKHDRWWKDSER